MRHPLPDIELIEHYFDNALTVEESEAFKARLKTDAEFRNLFEQEKLLVSTIRFQAARADLSYLKDVEQSISENRPGNLKRSWYYMAAAACVALIALVLFNPFEKDSPEALYANYFQPYPNVFEPILRGDDLQTDRAGAFQAYEQGNYERASTLFERLIQENKEPGMLMLLGNANMMTGDSGEARRNFIDLLNESNALDTEARWYLGLLHLKAGEVEEARKLFSEVAGTEGSYGTAAQELLEKLE